MKRNMICRLWPLILVLAIVLPACQAEVKEESRFSLVLSPTQELYIELEEGETARENFVTVLAPSEEIFFWDVRFVSSNEKIATVRHERTEKDIYLFYVIEAHSCGEAYISFESEDGSVSSELIRVRVTEKKEVAEVKETSPEIYEEPALVYVTKTGTKYHYKEGCAGQNATEMPLAEAKKTRSPCRTCVPNADELEALMPETSSQPSESTEPAGPVVVDPTVVYVTPSGTKYHYKEGCAGVNAMETTLGEALTDGKTACKTCSPKDEPGDEPEDDEPTEPTEGRIVYVTPSGTKYHYKQSHAGKNATEMTIEEAIAAGKMPCKTCAK